MECPSRGVVFVLICRQCNARNICATFVGLTLHSACSWTIQLTLSCLFICAPCISSSLHLPKHAVIIHYNYFNRSLAAIKLGWSSELCGNCPSLQFTYSFEHLKYFDWGQRAPWFLTPTDFLPPPFSPVPSTILCQCIPSTFCRILTYKNPGLLRFEVA